MFKDALLEECWVDECCSYTLGTLRPGRIRREPVGDHNLETPGGYAVHRLEDAVLHVLYAYV